MEIKNEFILDKKLLTEAIYLSVSKNRFIDFVLAGALFVLGIIVCIIKTQAGEPIDWKVIIYFVCAVLLVVLGFTFHLSAVSQRYDKYKMAYGKEKWKRTTVFHSNRIDTVEKNKLVSSFKYSSITRIYESKNLYILMSKKEIAAIVKKDDESFTAGSLKETKEYVNRMMKIG